MRYRINLFRRTHRNDDYDDNPDNKIDIVDTNMTADFSIMGRKIQQESSQRLRREKAKVENRRYLVEIDKNHVEPKVIATTTTSTTTQYDIHDEQLAKNLFYHNNYDNDNNNNNSIKGVLGGGGGENGYTTTSNENNDVDYPEEEKEEDISPILIDENSNHFFYFREENNNAIEKEDNNINTLSPSTKFSMINHEYFHFRPPSSGDISSTPPLPTTVSSIPPSFNDDNNSADSSYSSSPNNYDNYYFGLQIFVFGMVCILLLSCLLYYSSSVKKRNQDERIRKKGKGSSSNNIKRRNYSKNFYPFLDETEYYSIDKSIMTKKNHTMNQYKYDNSYNDHHHHHHNEDISFHDDGSYSTIDDDISSFPIKSIEFVRTFAATTIIQPIRSIMVGQYPTARTTAAAASSSINKPSYCRSVYKGNLPLTRYDDDNASDDEVEV